jgi:cardiolipin synthase
MSIKYLSFFGSFWLIAEWIIRIVSLYVVPKNRKPSSAMAWLLLIFFFPELGIIIFLIIGNPKLPKSRRNVQKTLNKIIATTLHDLKNKQEDKKLLSAEVEVKYQQIAKLAQSLSHLPVFNGNKIKVLSEYNKIFESIVNDLDGAKNFIYLEYFILVLDESTLPIFDALKRAIDRGVQVRVLYDSFSTKKFKSYKKMVKRLVNDGVVVQEILPLRLPGKGYVRPDLRNHRKLVVVDGIIGYSGSQNIVQRDYHRSDDIFYDELVIRMSGPAVLQLSAIFLTDWFSETGILLDYHSSEIMNKQIQSYGETKIQVLPSGPGYEDENNLKLFTSIIYAATKSIVLVNPYFVPDISLLNAITSAAKRGVEVTLINSEAIDQWMVAHAQRSFYEVLLKAGVKIYCYNSPVLLHSKFIIIDDEVVTVGSSNLDIRSFELDLELTVICYDAKVVKDFKVVSEKYLDSSKQVHLDAWLKRSRKSIFLNNIARLTSSLQ